VSEDSVSVAERSVEIFNREFGAGQTGISAEARALYVPEPVIVPFRAALEETEYSGPNALESFVADTRESWEWVRIEPDEVRELDARRALIIGKLIGRGRETGAEASSPIAILLTVRDGRVAEARTFLSERDALKAEEA
jgi:ketosteroid isomerase-like protein